MSDLDALAREHSDVEEYILAALSDEYFNLKRDKDTIEFLKIVFDGAHKDLDMDPTQVTEVLPKSADAGEYIADFEKSKAPQFKGKSKKKRREMAVAAFMAANKGKMKKEEILKAVKEVLAENKAYKVTSASGQTTTQSFSSDAEANDFKVKNTNVKDVKALQEDDWQDANDESSMAKSELYSIAKYAIELMKMIEDGEQLDAWVQSKITKAADYIDSVKHYMEGEKALAGTDEVEEGNLGHNELASLEPEGRFWIVTYRTMDGKKEKVFTDEDEARTFMGTISEAKKKLDPVGKEDKDIDNDGDVDKTDKYLKKRRVKIGQAIASHKK